MKNRQTMARIAASCVVACVAPSLEARPPIKLFDASAEESSSAPGTPEVQPSEVIIESASGVQVGSTSSPSEEVIRPVVHVQGTSMLIEAEVQGREVLFLLDTGASYTTLTPWFARLIGAMPAHDAPVATFRTASGMVTMPFGVVSSLELGGVRHRHVTFSVCEACGEAQVSGSKKRAIVGVLGMNVLGRYRVDLDVGSLGLVRGSTHANRQADIAPWVELTALGPGGKSVSRDEEGRWPIDVTLTNRGPRTIKRATAILSCGTATGLVQWSVMCEDLDVGKQVTRTIFSEVSARSCQTLDMKLADATW